MQENKKLPRFGLLDVILIFYLFFLVWTISLIAAGIANQENSAGYGIMFGLVLFPVWLVTIVPACAMVLYGFRSAGKMLQTEKKIRRTICILAVFLNVATVLLATAFF